MAENEGVTRQETIEREKRSGQPGLDEQLLRQGAGREDASVGKPREDVSDRDVGQDGILEKGIGGHGADAEAEAERRSAEPLSDNG